MLNKHYYYCNSSSNRNSNMNWFPSSPFTFCCALSAQISVLCSGFLFGAIVIIICGHLWLIYLLPQIVTFWTIYLCNISAIYRLRQSSAINWTFSFFLFLNPSSIFASARLATWKHRLVGGDQTHDGLDDCHDLKDVITRIAENEKRDLAHVVCTGQVKSLKYPRIR